MTKQISRRDFLQQSAAATVGFTVIPSFVAGKNISGVTAPSEKLNIAAVGISNTHTVPDGPCRRYTNHLERTEI